ncbi:MAG: SPOR domain-containing protein [Methylovirgula sp.]
MINLDEFERRLGRPAAPSARSGEDPLAELARLVGGAEDRYKTVFQARPAASTASRYATERQQPAPPAPPVAAPRRLGGDFAAIEAGLRGSIGSEFAAAPAAEFRPDLDQPEPDTDDWLDAPYLPPPQMSEVPRSRLPLYATAAIIIAGMAGIGTSFALKRHSVTPHQIAMIRAEQGPTKIQAANTAGTPKPQEISLLDSSPQVPVAVVSHSEEPANLRPAPASTAARTPTSASQQPSASQMQIASASPAAVVPVPAPPAAEAQGPAFGLAGLIEPRKVKTVVVRPDGTIVSNDAPQEPPVSAPQDLPTVAPPQEMLPVGPGPVPLDTTATTSNASSKTTRRAVSESPGSDSASGNEAAAPAAEPDTHSARARPMRVAEANATVAARQADDGHDFAVQLAAPQTEAEARHSMAKLQREYASLLSGLRLKYHRATVADKSYYRVRVVGLSHAEATALCEKLQAKGGSCYVARSY